MWSKIYDHALISTEAEASLWHWISDLLSHSEARTAELFAIISYSSSNESRNESIETGKNWESYARESDGFIHGDHLLSFHPETTLHSSSSLTGLCFRTRKHVGKSRKDTIQSARTVWTKSFPCCVFSWSLSRLFQHSPPLPCSPFRQTVREHIYRHTQRQDYTTWLTEWSQHVG